MSGQRPSWGPGFAARAPRTGWHFSPTRGAAVCSVRRWR